MGKRVTTIPATINKYTAAPVNSAVKRKVAGYARVSTDHEDQTNSYEAQVDYFTNYIKGRDDWEFAGMYADEGITGTNTRKRDGFNQMIEDALAGKINLIITKSVSRFARNTVDSLTTIRKLKENNIEVYFEKENIWTFDSKGELLLTIMSSLAQEESRSISENTTWGQRKRFADGKVSVPFKHFLGYDRGADGNLIVNPEQAKTVKLIYKLYLDGMTFHTIARKLTEMGIKTPSGKDNWSQKTVQSILTNEKYKGDALLQKHYTADFLTKKQKINNGEVPQYYVEDNHEAIIEPKIFDQVQAEITRRSKQKGRYSGISIFSSKLKCGDCGSWYGAKVWHSTDQYRKVIYRCNHKFNGEHRCQTPHLTEEEIKALFIKAVNLYLVERDELLTNVEMIRQTLCNTETLETDLEKYRQEMEVLVEMTQNAIDENARVAVDQTEYTKRYNSLVDRYEAAKAKFEQTRQAIENKQIQSGMLQRFSETIRNLGTVIDEFDESLWASVVDFAMVKQKKEVTFTFIDGVEITVE